MPSPPNYNNNNNNNNNVSLLFIIYNYVDKNYDWLFEIIQLLLLLLLLFGDGIFKKD